MGLTCAGTGLLRLKIGSRVNAATIQFEICILKNAITIHFVWHRPAKVSLSLVPEVPHFNTVQIASKRYTSKYFEVPVVLKFTTSWTERNRTCRSHRTYLSYCTKFSGWKYLSKLPVGTKFSTVASVGTVASAGTLASVVLIGIRIRQLRQIR